MVLMLIKINIRTIPVLILAIQNNYSNIAGYRKFQLSYFP